MGMRGRVVIGRQCEKPEGTDATCVATGILLVCSHRASTTASLARSRARLSVLDGQAQACVIERSHHLSSIPWLGQGLITCGGFAKRDLLQATWRMRRNLSISDKSNVSSSCSSRLCVGLFEATRLGELAVRRIPRISNFD